jgi:hypothetical protein
MKFRLVFVTNCHFLVKLNANIWILSQNFKKFKTCKKLYKWQYFITNSKYGHHHQEIRSFVQFFLPQTGIFWLNRRLITLDFELNFLFLNQSKLMHTTIMYNKSIIWALGPQNIEFRSVFLTNWHFSVKPKANTFGFWAEIRNFLKPVKTYIWDHYV